MNFQGERDRAGASRVGTGTGTVLVKAEAICFGSTHSVRLGARKLTSASVD